MSRYRHNFLFIAATIAATSALVLIGGIGLEHVAERALPIIPLIVALPGLNDLVGNYATIIAAHTGNPEERQRTHRELARAISRVIGINIGALIVLSLITAVFRGYVLEVGFIVRFALFVAIAVVVVVTFMFAIVGVLDRLLLRFRYNPDELLIPIVTALADVLMLLMVALGVLLVFL